MANYATTQIVIVSKEDDDIVYKMREILLGNTLRQLPSFVDLCDTAMVNAKGEEFPCIIGDCRWTAESSVTRSRRTDYFLLTYYHTHLLSNSMCMLPNKSIFQVMQGKSAHRDAIVEFIEYMTQHPEIKNLFMPDVVCLEELSEEEDVLFELWSEEPGAALMEHMIIYKGNIIVDDFLDYRNVTFETSDEAEEWANNTECESIERFHFNPDTGFWHHEDNFTMADIVPDNILSWDEYMEIYENYLRGVEL